MELVNHTKFDAAWTLGFERDGRELLVLAVKATYRIPRGREEVVLAEKQAPLTKADEFYGEPGRSATRYETDYAHRKPKCDVLLNGSAYSRNGAPVENVVVRLTVGSIRKRFQVFGDRVWDNILFSPMPTPPVRFTKQPFSYGSAYGGADQSESDPLRTDTYLDNPIGVGYYPLTTARKLTGKPLPNTCEMGHPVNSPKGQYRPMAFGAVSRNLKSRISFAGTYNQEWLDNRAPFWPDDFDYQYFQCAPAEQQTTYLSGGEEVVLENLTPEGHTAFRIPNTFMPVVFSPVRGKEQQLDAVCDTLLIEADEKRFMLTWRASFPLRRNMFELKQIIVGETLQNWRRIHRREISGKRHYTSLEELIRDKRRSGGKR